MFKKLNNLIDLELQCLTEKLEILKQERDINGYYLEIGKEFEETFGKIINTTPTCAKDCVDIFEFWADNENGLISVCRPDSEKLRQYAKYTGNSLTFQKWINTRKLV